jgi:phospholipid/cholesterol/gamma-HCH transport system permease protein
MLRLTANTALGAIDKVGHRVVSMVFYTFEVLSMTYLAGRAAFFDQSQGLRAVFRVVSAQIYFTGWQAMPLVTVLALAAGGIVVMQASAQLSLLGNADMVGNLMIVIIVRELGPLITALLVIARSGTAVASEIGNMRVGREIEALEALGIDPMSFIVFPRLLGGVISVVCLAFYFDAIALFGGFALTRLLHDMPFAFYAGSLARAFGPEDAGLFLLKNGFSGIIIFVVACRQGLSVKQSSHEVPQVTTNAVVNSVIYVTSFNLAATTLFYVNQLMRLGIL